MLDPALVAFLNGTYLQDSALSEGNSSFHQGWSDWRSIFPWVQEVVKAANEHAQLSPELCIDDNAYSSLVRRFDKNFGGFISQCPAVENIRPFARFVVTVLYLESQEKLRQHSERERRLRELLEREAPAQGLPRVTAVSDSEHGLDLLVSLPSGQKESVAGHPCKEDSVNADDLACSRPPDGLDGEILQMDSILWPDFDPQATGPDAVLCPPPGEYKVSLGIPPAVSAAPFHWACQVVAADGQSQQFSATQHPDHGDKIEVFAFVFAPPHVS